MNTMRIPLYSVLLLIFFSATTLYANSPQRGQESGLSGSFGIGSMFINSANNLDPSGSKRHLTTLDEGADRQLTVLPFILPEVTYRFNDETGATVYFKTRPALDELGGLSLNLGTTMELGDHIGTIDGAVFISFLNETWKNPYILEEARRATATSQYGGLVALDRIGGTPLRMRLAVMADDVDEDVIGSLQPDLARDGEVYVFSASYALLEAPLYDLRPAIAISRGDYQGESNSYYQGKLELGGRYTRERLSLLPKVFLSHSDFDKTDPIFGTTRKVDGYGAKLLVSLAAPFGYSDWALQALLGISRGDANIDFYDTEAITYGIFATYSF